MSDPYGNPYGQQPYGQQPHGQQPYGQQPPYGQPTPPPYGQPTPPPYLPQQPFVQAGPPVSPEDERTFSMVAHLGQILLSFVAPLLVYVIYKDRSQYIRWHSSQALNFAITGFIYTMGVLFISLLTFGLGFLLFIPLGIIELVYLVQATVAANRGEWFRYPGWLALPMVN